MGSNKTLTHLLMLLLFSSCFLSLMAHSRQIEPKNAKLGIMVDEINQKSTGDQMGMEELNQIGRMDFETDDYPSIGANNKHVPKNPGRS